MAIKFKHEAETDEEFYYELCSFLMRNKYYKGTISCESKRTLDGLADYMTSINIPWVYSDYEEDIDIGYRLEDDSEDEDEDEDTDRQLIIQFDDKTVIKAKPKDQKRAFRRLEFEPFNIPIHLKNVEIRDMFLRTFQYAEEEIDIISPWMNNAVVNDEFKERMQFAMDRGVIIKIKYGLKPNDSEYNISRSVRSDKVAESLKNRFKKYYNSRLFIERDNIHYKLVLCDEKYKLEGSYNYLSFTGNYNDDTRKEGSPFGTNVEEIRQLRGDYFGNV